MRVAFLGETIQDTDEYETLLAGIADDPPGGAQASTTRGPGDLDRASSGQPARQTGNERHRRARHRRPGEHVGASQRHATRT